MTSRPPPPAFEAFVDEGVRFEPEYATTREPRLVRSCALVAVEVATGHRLWSVPLWTSVDDAILGLSVPPRYLRRVVRGPDADTLLAEDEHGALYLVDRIARTAREHGRVPPRSA